MAKMKKTNVMRILDSNKIKYSVHTYESSDDINDAVSVAGKIGKNPDSVFKTLVTRGMSKELYVFVIPGPSELDLKKAASAAGEKKIEMIPVKDLLSATGYIRGGCSPVGMKKHYRTFIDSSAKDLESIVVSAGKIGFQTELKPADLIETVNGELKDLIVNR